MDRPLDAVRLIPGDDAATVTAGQVRGVVGRLIAAGHWRPGDPEILLVADAGYDGPRLAHVLADLPITVLVRMRPGCAAPRPHKCLAPGADPAATVMSSPSASPPPGANPSTPPKPRPASTARRSSGPGTGCTPG